MIWIFAFRRQDFYEPFRIALRYWKIIWTVTYQTFTHWAYVCLSIANIILRLKHIILYADMKWRTQMFKTLTPMKRNVLQVNFDS